MRWCQASAGMAVITDVRADHGGEGMLQASFRQVDVLEQGSKSALMMARLPKDAL